MKIAARRASLLGVRVRMSPSFNIAPQSERPPPTTSDREKRAPNASHVQHLSDHRNPSHISIIPLVRSKWPRTNPTFPRDPTQQASTGPPAATQQQARNRRTSAPAGHRTPSVAARRRDHKTGKHSKRSKRSRAPRRRSCRRTSARRSTRRSRCSTWTRTAGSIIMSSRSR